MEGKGTTAEQSPPPGGNGAQGDQKGQGRAQGYDEESQSLSGANSLTPGNELSMSTQPSSGGTAPSASPGEPGEGARVPDPQPDQPQPDQPHARVDARLLEATLLNLHKRI